MRRFLSGGRFVFDLRVKDGLILRVLNFFSLGEVNNHDFSRTVPGL